MTARLARSFADGRGAFAAAVALCAGCYAVLGIEEVTLDPSLANPEAGADGNAPPSGCDKSPREDARTVVDRCGVFVSPTGSDGAPGTRAAPLKSIDAAIEAAVAQRVFRVYACAGAYPEKATIGRDGVAVFGGLDCGSWQYTGKPARIAPAQPGFALRIDGAVSPVVIEDVELSAQAGAGAGASSVAAFVSGSAEVTFRRVAFVAGDGQPGTDGAAGTPQTMNTDAGAGNPGIGTGGGLAKTCGCLPSLTSSTGGAGGPGVSGAGAAGMQGQPDGGAGGVVGQSCGGLGAGGIGGNGSTGANAPAPAAPYGTIAATGWIPANGSPGGYGEVGRGGGGGRGNPPSAAGGGGSGGCGGCGGGGGAGGTGGGSSIGLLVQDARISLVDCSIATKAGGNGGAGGPGAAGQSGFPGGVGGNGQGCPGGAGGFGGSGAAGGGGAGGVSVGVVHQGTPPTLDTATQGKITTGAPGAGGAGSTKGADGVAAPTLKL